MEANRAGSNCREKRGAARTSSITVSIDSGAGLISLEVSVKPAPRILAAMAAFSRRLRANLRDHAGAIKTKNKRKSRLRPAGSPSRTSASHGLTLAVSTAIGNSPASFWHRECMAGDHLGFAEAVDSRGKHRAGYELVRSAPEQSVAGPAEHGCLLESRARPLSLIASFGWRPKCRERRDTRSFRFGLFPKGRAGTLTSLNSLTLLNL
jgi:hypothetical protein